MLHKDYMMRLIEITMRALSKVSLLVEEKKYLDAIDTVTEAGKMITGLDFKMLEFVSDIELMNMIKSKDGLYKGKFLVLGELLAREGELHLLDNNPDKSYHSYLKSLSFYIDGFDENESIIFEDYIPKIDNVIEALSEYDLPLHLKGKMIRFYELTQRYSKADDIIFDAVKNKDSELYKPAFDFYTRLLEKTDEEIEKGNLTREEAEESFSEIKSLTKS